MRRSTAFRLIAVLLTVGLVAACGADEPTEPDATESAGEMPTVSGGFGEAPEVEIPAGAAGDELVVEVVDEGDGDAVVDGQLIVANYQMLVWPAEAATPTASADDESGDEDAGGSAPLFDTFETGQPEPLLVAEESLLPGMVKGLIGANVGSRILVVIPPAEGFGDTGREEMGVGPEDSLVFVFDVLEAFDGDQAAEGTAVEPPAGGPTVAEGDEGPTITVPAETAPTELVVQPLIQGDGAEVEAGQVIVVQYRGVLWKDGNEFDSTWAKGQPTGFIIGTGNVIPGWDNALVGQQIGSRVLITVPPAEGYGPEGNPPAITGEDTLVFVIDILGAYGATAAPAPSETPTS